MTWRTGQRDARAKANGRLIKAATARRELVVLGAALQWNWKEKNLDRPVPIHLPPPSEARERYLTRHEAAQLLAAALGWNADGTRNPFRINRHLARFILIGIYTGTRHDAILKLQWRANTMGGWVDLEAGVLYRRPSAAVESSKRRPAIPIPPRLMPHLTRWRRLTARYVVEWQGQGMASQERRAWHSARAMAGLDAAVTPHVMRHTCATWLLQHGVTTYYTAGVLGCSEEVVRRTYGHHARGELWTAVDVFSRRPAALPSSRPR